MITTLERIQGIALAVWRSLGPCHTEPVYQKAMEEEGMYAGYIEPSLDRDKTLCYFTA